MKKFMFISLLFFFLVNQKAFSRFIREDPGLISDGLDSTGKPGLLQWGLSAKTQTCEPVYGVLPCSDNVWGLLFLIVVYEILLSVGERYVANGSGQLFTLIGPDGIFGASLFQFLGTIPQIVLVLVSALSGTTEAAQRRATLGMGLVAGSTAMLLTLIWGLCVYFGSYDLSQANNSDDANQNNVILKGFGVVTDAETSFTARIVLISLIPFVTLLPAMFFGSSGRRVIILISLIITVVLLISFIFYQIFQPWIQNRRFEYLVNKYAKDKVLRLLSRHGKPDTKKIQELFDRIDKNNSSSVSPAELRVWFLGARLDEDDLSMERDMENVMASIDISGDGRITKNEFVKGMTKLVSDLEKPAKPSARSTPAASNTTDNSGAQQPLLTNNTTPSTATAPSNIWLTIISASFFLILGTVMLSLLAEPLIRSVVEFAQITHLSSFAVAYLAIPLAMNYRVAVQSIASASQRTQKSISLTLSALYGAVYMNNIIGLIVFLAPVYVRDLSANVSAEVLVVLILCILMTLFTSFRTTFPRWTSYIVLSLYPISLASVYVVTTILGWA